MLVVHFFYFLFVIFFGGFLLQHLSFSLIVLFHLLSYPLLSSVFEWADYLFLCLDVDHCMCVCPLVDVSVCDRLIIGLTVGHGTYLKTHLTCLWGTHTYSCYYYRMMFLMSAAHNYSFGRTL